MSLFKIYASVTLIFTSDKVLFYVYLIALYTSYENRNVFAVTIREEVLQSANIQSFTDYRAFLMPCCLSFYLMKHGKQFLKSCFNGINIINLT